MARFELSTRLSSLEDTASKLNEASNSVTAVLNAVEKRLASMNIGLEVWLDDKPLRKTDRRFIEGDDGGDAVVHWVEKRLGYARIDKKWCLAVKSVQMNGPTEERDEPLEVATDGDPIPLAQASRRIRLSAVRLMPRFIDRLERGAEEAIEAIEQATKLVE
jgi:hypothetical protein